jgi:hypothetical protein
MVIVSIVVVVVVSIIVAVTVTVTIVLILLQPCVLRLRKAENLSLVPALVAAVEV